MKKKEISVDQLRPGMFVEELDISWLKSPFLRHRRKIESEKDIILYKQYGVKQLTINLDKGLDIADSNTISEPDSHQDSLQNTIEEPVEPAIDGSLSPGLKAEMGPAKMIQNKVHALAKQINEEIKNGRPPNIEALEEVIEETVNSLKRNDQALLTLLHIQRGDGRLNRHPFGVFSLVLPLALKQNLSDSEIEILGMAALVHDCGWARLPANLFAKGRPYTPNEQKLVRQHPQLAAHALRKSKDIPAIVIELVEQHHDLPDINGAAENSTSPLLEYLQIADHYDEYIHGLGPKPGVLPVNALKLLYKESQAGYFSESLVSQLVRILGIYPISSMVKLDTGEIGVVCEVNRQMPMSPKVCLIYDSEQNKVKPSIVDLEHEDGRSILEVIDPSSIDEDPYSLLSSL